MDSMKSLAEVITSFKLRSTPSTSMASQQWVCWMSWT